jgi:hypothetical protein
MKKTDFDRAGELQRVGLMGDNQTLANHGIEPCSEEAGPFYLAWIRTDLVLLVSLLASLTAYARALVALLAIIAAMLAYLVFFR